MPRCATIDCYITVLKIKKEICQDGRQIKTESLL